MRASQGVPIVFIGDPRETVELQRIDLNESSIMETWVQELVFEHPAVLPIEDIDPWFAPPVPIAREVTTTAGSIDALYVSPTGGLTIVETKLWRNPEARRQVVGQILDYAAALSSWSYDELDNVARNATGTSLWEQVAGIHGGGPPLSEADFVDTVARDLRAGRFLLLVVGDGIRDEVERMASYVQSSPRLQFHLALVELRIHEDLKHSIRTVVPSVVAQTQEVIRAVVHVNVAESASVEVKVTVPGNDAPVTDLDWLRSELEEHTKPYLASFVFEMLDAFRQDPRFKLDRRVSSISLRLKNPIGHQNFTVLVFTTHGEVYPGWLQQQCEATGIPVEVGFRFVAALSELTGIPIHPDRPDNLVTKIPLSVVAERWDEVRDLVEQLADDLFQELA